MSSETPEGGPRRVLRGPWEGPGKDLGGSWDLWAGRRGAFGTFGYVWLSYHDPLGLGDFLMLSWASHDLLLPLLPLLLGTHFLAILEQS